MTNKDAIENLQYLISNDCTETQHDFVEEIEMAIQALKKQIPKKPIDRRSLSNISDGGNCRMCKQFITQVFDFCPHCGQVIDWR